MDMEGELARARELDVAELADAIETIGFECTRCGACCKGHGEDEHTATVSPDEVRDLQAATEYDWRDVARPTPFGLHEDADGEPAGETFEWALQNDACGNCTFYEETDEEGACTVHEDRPAICQTYPFSVDLTSESSGGSSQHGSGGGQGATSQPMGAAVDREGVVRAHECEGLGRDISRADAEDLAVALKERAVTELEEAISVREEYEPANTAPGEVVVHDSEGAKRPDGTELDGAD